MLYQTLKHGNVEEINIVADRLDPPFLTNTMTMWNPAIQPCQPSGKDGPQVLASCRLILLLIGYDAEQAKMPQKL